MTFRSTTRHKGVRIAATLADLDSGSGNARLRVYGGTRRATADDAPGTTMLAEITLAKPCGALSSNVLVLAPSPVALGAANGTATWAIFVTGNGDEVCDGLVSLAGGGGDVMLTDLAIYVGGSVAVVSGTLT